MSNIESASSIADISWDKDGRPILYVVGRGDSQSVRQMVQVIATAVKTVNEGPFEHVCCVYNMLNINLKMNVPQLGRLVRNKEIPSTPRTAHIIVGTQNPLVRMIGTVIAVTGSKRIRTVDVCSTQAEIDAAIQRWLSLPEHVRHYTADNPLQD